MTLLLPKSLSERAEGNALLERPARATDALQAAPLVFASGRLEFGFLFGVPEEQCIAFLRAAFASTHGQFSWRRHWVSAAEADVVGVLAAHGSRSTLSDNLWFAWMTLRFFGLRQTVGVLRRGLILESELPPPSRGETLLAHCATRADVRNRGIFSALLNAAKSSATQPSIRQNDSLVLDVLLTNDSAARLYRRLGFVSLARKRPRARTLPAELESVRMRFVQGERTRHAGGNE
jgi:ribosomal protein S18 acetylase RimI-like enzyme